jgi:hypothetical protein
MEILEHQFNRRLESFAPCYSQSLLLADLKKTRFISGFNDPYKKIRETKRLESTHEWHFVEQNNEGRKTKQKLESEKYRVHA